MRGGERRGKVGKVGRVRGGGEGKRKEGQAGRESATGLEEKYTVGTARRGRRIGTNLQKAETEKADTDIREGRASTCRGQDTHIGLFRSLSEGSSGNAAVRAR